MLNIWVKRREEAFEAARPITADTKRPVRIYFWTEDSRFVVYQQDRGGDENYRIYAVDPGAAADQATGVPPARDLTPLESVRAMVYALPEKTPGQIYVGLNDRDAQVHDVYRIDLGSGERTLVRKNDANVVGWVFDLDGRLRLGLRVTADGGTEILRIDGEKLEPVYTCSAEESCSPVRFHKDGRRVYLNTNRGDADLARLTLFDVETRQEEVVDSDPEKQVDLTDARFSDATEELVSTGYLGDRLRQYPKTPVSARDHEVVRKALPDGDFYFISSTEDESLHLVAFESDREPGAGYLYDRGAGTVTLLYRVRPKLPTDDLAPMKPVRYRARDGIEIPGYLTTPKGVDARKLPAVMVPHGGPWARDSWGYDGIAQFLANRGYAVLQPNFRGSSGYGKRFLNLGNGQWGTGTMQHDITDGVKWLVEQGIAEPSKVAIMGGSYGGYATLAGLTFTPDVYAAGVDIVGPSSIVTLLESIPPYWKPIRKIFDVRVGKLEDPKDRERMKAQSPLHFATQIKAPLLVIQGANDPRVKQREADQIVVALRDLGRTVEYVVAPDEGHGFAGRENRLAMFASIERFLARQIGGRHQESVPPAIAQKLASLTVDPKSVTVTAVAEVKGEMPSFSGESIRPGTMRYGQKMSIMGRPIEMTTTRTVAAESHEGRPVWVVTDEAATPMGAASDKVVVDRRTLLPIKRSARQGPAEVELSFKPDAVKGSVKAGGQDMPVDVKVDGAVLSDGGAMHVAVSTLPLSPGYTAPLRSFEVMGGRVRSYRLVVKDKEQVSVPAGKFEAVRVEIESGDGEGGATLWIETAQPHRVVKSQSKLPAAAGGGLATSELLGAK